MTDPSLKLEDRPILFLDGGLGTTLEEDHGVQFSSTLTPLWSSHLLISAPQTLLKAQTDFVRAGAEVLLTATYQASFEGFGRTPRVGESEREAVTTAGEGGGGSRGGSRVVGYDRAEATTYMRNAVGIARSAFRDAGRAGCVVLSLGAYGATMVPSQEYTGEYSPPALMEAEGLYGFHLDRVAYFAEDDEAWRDVDLVAFETLPRLSEVTAVRMVMGTVNERAKAGSEKQFWISCVFPDEDGDLLPDGGSVADVVVAMLAESDDRGTTARPFAIGINCTKVHRLRTLIQKFESASQKLNLDLPRLVIYPDGASGLIYDTVAQTWVAASVDANNSSKDTASPERKRWHEEVAEIVREVQERCAWKGIIVGGCCKTTPAHIAELRKSLG